MLARRKNALVHSYEHGISGFTARLSAAEAQSIAKNPGVVSVFPDTVYQLHTTRSWDFLKYGTDVKIDLSPNSDSNLSSRGYDVIIGILDTGEISCTFYINSKHHFFFQKMTCKLRAT